MHGTPSIWAGSTEIRSKVMGQAQLLLQLYAEAISVRQRHLPPNLAGAAAWPIDSGFRTVDDRPDHEANNGLQRTPTVDCSRRRR